MNPDQYFRGLEDLPKTICDKKGHKPTPIQWDSVGNKYSGCKRCTCIIIYGYKKPRGTSNYA